MNDNYKSIESDRHQADYRSIAAAKINKGLKGAAF
jgi:hypothetical protein